MVCVMMRVGWSRPAWINGMSGAMKFRGRRWS
jgi:hypothetical protein